MTTYNVPDMSCGHCKASITDALMAKDGTVELAFDMNNRLLTVAGLEAEQVIEVLDEIGFPATAT